MDILVGNMRAFYDTSYDSEDWDLHYTEAVSLMLLLQYISLLSKASRLIMVQLQNSWITDCVCSLFFCSAIREELQSVQRELEVLSEQYSQKCLENAHLAQALEAERQALRQCQRENQELNAHNQVMAKKNSPPQEAKQATGRFL